MLKIIVLISGSGSNLQAIIDACNAKMINGCVIGVISNKANAYGLERAKKNNIPTNVIDHNDFTTREGFDKELVSSINIFQPDLVVLAGFMRILYKEFMRIAKLKHELGESNLLEQIFAETEYASSKNELLLTSINL